MKTNIWQFLVKVFLIALVAFLFVPSAFAFQGEVPPPTNDVASMVIAGILFVVLAFAVSTGVEQGTEVVKVIVALLARFPIMSWLPQGGMWSWIYAGLMSVATIFGFNIDIFSPIDLFANVDPVLVRSIATLIIWALAQYVHRKLYPDGTRSPSAQARLM